MSQRILILAKTVKANIIFSQEFKQYKYEEAIQLACLTDDLKVVPKGDKTKIGEKESIRAEDKNPVFLWQEQSIATEASICLTTLSLSLMFMSG